VRAGAAGDHEIHDHEETDDRRDEESVGLGAEGQAPEETREQDLRHAARLVGDEEDEQRDGEEDHLREVLDVRQHVADDARPEQQQAAGDERRRGAETPLREQVEKDDEGGGEQDVDGMEAVEGIEERQHAREEAGGGGGEDVGDRVVLPGSIAKGRGGQIGHPILRIGIGGEVEIAAIEGEKEREVAIAEEEVAEGLVPGDVVLIEGCEPRHQHEDRE
jgi:hypothetical protein